MLHTDRYNVDSLLTICELYPGKKLLSYLEGRKEILAQITSPELIAKIISITLQKIFVIEKYDNSTAAEKRAGNNEKLNKLFGLFTSQLQDSFTFSGLLMLLESINKMNTDHCCCDQLLNLQADLVMRLAYTISNAKDTITLLKFVSITNSERFVTIAEVYWQYGGFDKLINVDRDIILADYHKDENVSKLKPRYTVDDYIDIVRLLEKSDVLPFLKRHKKVIEQLNRDADKVIDLVTLVFAKVIEHLSSNSWYSDQDREAFLKKNSCLYNEIAEIFEPCFKRFLKAEHLLKLIINISKRYEDPDESKTAKTDLRNAKLCLAGIGRPAVRTSGDMVKVMGLLCEDDISDYNKKQDEYWASRHFPERRIAFLYGARPMMGLFGSDIKKKILFYAGLYPNSPDPRDQNQIVSKRSIYC